MERDDYTARAAALRDLSEQIRAYVNAKVRRSPSDRVGELMGAAITLREHLEADAARLEGEAALRAGRPTRVAAGRAGAWAGPRMALPAGAAELVEVAS